MPLVRIQNIGREHQVQPKSLYVVSLLIPRAGACERASKGHYFGETCDIAKKKTHKQQHVPLSSESIRVCHYSII